jgi:hypothetical protein
MLYLQSEKGGFSLSYEVAGSLLLQGSKDKAGSLTNKFPLHAYQMVFQLHIARILKVMIELRALTCNASSQKLCDTISLALLAFRHTALSCGAGPQASKLSVLYCITPAACFYTALCCDADSQASKLSLLYCITPAACFQAHSTQLWCRFSSKQRFNSAALTPLLAFVYLFLGMFVFRYVCF